MIYVSSTCKGEKINKQQTRKIAQAGLKLLGAQKESISICFVGDKEMVRLNKKYRKKNKATPVLSFYLKQKKPIKGMRNILGDVVISYDMVRKSAKLNRRSMDTQIRLYLTHGILNLCNVEA